MSVPVAEREQVTVSVVQIAEYFNAASLGRELAVFEAKAPERRTEESPLRVDGLMLMLCREGSGHVAIDLGEYEVEPNTLLVLQPRNYIIDARFSADFKAHCILAAPEILEEVSPKLTDILPLLLHNRARPVSLLCENDARGIDMFYHFLSAKLRGPRTPLLRKKLMCVLEAAMLELMDIQLSNSDGRIPAKTRREELMAKFILAVSRDFMTNREVSYYADQLCISTKHLSTTVKEASGRTPGEWIENYVVMEAKLLLRSTDLTIQEIARRLNFSNQSFFGKYFKNVTGISPTTYRRGH